MRVPHHRRRAEPAEREALRSGGHATRHALLLLQGALLRRGRDSLPILERAHRSGGIASESHDKSAFLGNPILTSAFVGNCAKIWRMPMDWIPSVVSESTFHSLPELLKFRLFGFGPF